MVKKNNFDLENFFYEKSEPNRLLKLLAQYELYKKIHNVSGDIYEFGVFQLFVYLDLDSKLCQ